MSINYATNLAVVKDGIVDNVIWGSVYDGLDILREEGYEIIPYGERAVQIGDSYQGGKFYRDGVEVRTRDEEQAELEDFLINALYEEIIEGE